MSKSPSLRRIQADIRELALEPSDRYHAAPLEDDMFEWHFTIRGPDGTEFEGGYYHGRILLPPEYPFKPPHILFITPSGRFETHTKICLSFTAFHKELWQPAWGIRLILEALISFLPAPADGAIGALDWTKEERKRVAIKSVDLRCDKCCGPISKLIPTACKKASSGAATTEATKPTSTFQKQIEMLHLLQAKTEKKNTSMKKEKDIETRENTAAGTTSTYSTTSLNEVVDSLARSMANPDQQQASDTLPSTVENTNDTNNTTLSATTSTTTSASSSWLSDPLIHGSIVTFAAIAFLLYRKIETLLTELEKLED